MDFQQDGIAVAPKVQNSAKFAPGAYKKGQLIARLTAAYNDGVAEVLKLTITGTADSNGSADIVLNGAAAVNISYASGDDPAAIATKIAAGTYTGWTKAAALGVVTFTKTTNSEVTGANTIAFTDSDTEPSVVLAGAFAVDTEGRDNSAIGSYAPYIAGDSTYGLAAIKAVCMEDFTGVYPEPTAPIAKGEFAKKKVTEIMAALDTPVTLTDALLGQCFAAGILLN